MTLESWNSAFNFASVALVGLTFVAGAGALWTGHRLNKIQTERLVTLETELATQQTRAADAERKLLEIQERLTDRQIGKDDELKLIAALKWADGPPRLGIIAPFHDGEAQRFVIVLEHVFRSAGWSNVNPITSAVHDPPPGLTLSRSSTVSVEYANRLRSAFASIGLLVTDGESNEEERGIADALVLFVGRKQP